MNVRGGLASDQHAAAAKKGTKAQPKRSFLDGPRVIALLIFVLYVALAVRLHQLYATRGYDLGIFDQYARDFAAGRAPTSAFRAKGSELSQTGPNLFGDHFSPILYALGPVYRIYPHVESLLVLQAALVGASVLVVTRCATERLGRNSGVCIGVAYGLSWGIQQLVGFDFHEVAFELPLASLAMTAFLDERFKRAAVWATSLLLVKPACGSRPGRAGRRSRRP